MAIDTYIEREVALFIEHEPTDVIVLATLSEVSLIQEAITISVLSSEKEIAVATDNVASADAYTNVEEVALISDTVTDKRYAYLDLRDTASINDTVSITNRTQQIEREVALINDSPFQEAFVTVTDSALISDTVTASNKTNELIRSTSSIIDRATIIVANIDRELALITDKITQGLTSKLVERDVVLISDTAYTGGLNSNLTVRDTAYIQDRIRLTSNSQIETAKSTAYILDRAIPPLLDGGVAFTCSTISWGMSQYKNYPFSSITKKYAAGVSLWDRTGKTDNDEIIASHILTGAMDFDAPEFKAIDKVYFNGTADGETTLQVTADNTGGSRLQYDYTLPKRNQTSIRNNRVSIGRGFFSRYYQFKVKSESIDYKLKGLEVNIAQNNRRI